MKQVTGDVCPATQRQFRSGIHVRTYENERAYRKHLNAAPYKAFVLVHLTLLTGRRKLPWSHSFGRQTHHTE